MMELQVMGIKKIKVRRAVYQAIQVLVHGDNHGMVQQQQQYPEAAEGTDAEAVPTFYHIK